MANVNVIYPIDGNVFIEEIMKVCPSAEIGEDLDGQVIIYTGLQVVSSDFHLAPYKEKE